MPRETIYDASGMYDVQIGWGPGTVQVGIETHDGVPVAEKLNSLGGGDPARFTGLWGSLDREGCNRAIKMLRKARDDAFGRDE